MNDEKISPQKRAQLILDYWNTQAVDDMLKSGTGYDEKDIKSVKGRLEDSRTYSMETASLFLRGFSSEWASSGADYALSYDENILKVENKDVRSFVEKYIKDKKGLAVLFVNPEYYRENKKEFEYSEEDLSKQRRDSFYINLLHQLIYYYIHQFVQILLIHFY